MDHTRSRLTRTLVVLAAVLAVLVPGSPAWAHNALAKASPAKNATVKKAPTSVQLKFLQKLNPDLTTIAVTDEAKNPVPADEPEVDGATGSLTFTEPLGNGAYQVAYRVVSRDGHTVQGAYKFTVADPTQTASPAPSAEPATAAPSTPAEPSATPSSVAIEETSSTFSTVAGLITGIVVVLLLAGLGAVLFLRRRRVS
jgi:methionine-rich copper-binding protein CopC